MAKTQTHPHTDECCEDSACNSGLRNNYYDNKRLSPRSFQVEQAYTQQRRWLINRAVHGYGVVQGYEIKAIDQKKKFMIKAGLAIDEAGRELLFHGKVVDFHKITKIHPDKDCELESDEYAKYVQDKNYKIVLSVHYMEKYTSSVPTPHGCHCDHQEWDQTCETVGFSLRPVKVEDIAEYTQCKLSCACHEPEQVPKELQDVLPHPQRELKCHCEKPIGSMKLPEPKWLKKKESCALILLDLKHSVPLAWLEVVPEGDQLYYRKAHACHGRRRVMSNPVLYDLIRGCDLTRIINFGWKGWHRKTEEYDSVDFFKLLENEYSPENLGLWMKFSKPVLKETLKIDCFSMSIYSTECRDKWWQQWRVPITEIAFFDEEEINQASVVKFYADPVWLERVKESCIFEKSNARVELQFNGDYVRDCNGQSVDANAIGLEGVPSGNGTPGGTFYSNFRVAVTP